jgi:hypothetical protein
MVHMKQSCEGFTKLSSKGANGISDATAGAFAVDSSSSLTGGCKTEFTAEAAQRFGDALLTFAKNLQKCKSKPMSKSVSAAAHVLQTAITRQAVIAASKEQALEQKSPEVKAAAAAVENAENKLAADKVKEAKAQLSAIRTAKSANALQARADSQENAAIATKSGKMTDAHREAAALVVKAKAVAVKVKAHADAAHSTSQNNKHILSAVNKATSAILSAKAAHSELAKAKVAPSVTALIQQDQTKSIGAQESAAGAARQVARDAKSVAKVAKAEALHAHQQVIKDQRALAQAREKFVAAEQRALHPTPTSAAVVELGPE